MSEQRTEQTIAAALGAERPIYVGVVSVLDLASNVTGSKVAVAKRAREIVAQAEGVESPPTVVTVIDKLARLIDPGPDADKNLTTEQKNAIADNIARLAGIHELAEQADTDEARGNVIRQLHGTYFAYQGLLTETDAGHHLRLAGDAYAVEVNFDFDVAWEIFQEELETSQRPPRPY